MINLSGYFQKLPANRVKITSPELLLLVFILVHMIPFVSMIKIKDTAIYCSNASGKVLFGWIPFELCIHRNLTKYYCSNSKGIFLNLRRHNGKVLCGRTTSGSSFVDRLRIRVLFETLETFSDGYYNVYIANINIRIKQTIIPKEVSFIFFCHMTLYSNDTYSEAAQPQPI